MVAYQTEDGMKNNTPVNYFSVQYLSILLTSLLFSQFSFSLDMNDVESRIEKLQSERSETSQEIDKLEKELKQLKKGLKSSPKDVDKRLKAIDKKVSKSKKRTKKRIGSVKRIIGKERDRLVIQGFVTAGLTKSDTDAQAGNLLFEDDSGHRNDTRVGLQTQFRLADNASATIQLLAYGYENFDIDAEWGYLTYKLPMGMKVRAGRMKLPLYYYSESKDVGFSYAWTRPPLEFYNEKQEVYEAFEFLYNVETGPVLHALKIGWGSFDEQNYDVTLAVNPSDSADVISLSTYEASDIYAINYELMYRGLTARLAYTRMDLVTGITGNSAADIATVGVKTDNVTPIASASLIYDDGTWFVAAEHARISPDSGVISAEEKSYLTFGRYIERWFPYITLATLETEAESDDIATAIAGSPGVLPFVSARESDSISLGVRYAFSQRVAFKFEYNRFDDFGTTPGLFNPTLSDDLSDDLRLMSLTVDAVF